MVFLDLGGSLWCRAAGWLCEPLHCEVHHSTQECLCPIAFNAVRLAHILVFCKCAWRVLLKCLQAWRMT